MYSVLNLLAILWLMGCLYASYKDASEGATLWSLFSFTNLFAVVVNVFFVISWLFSKRKKMALGSLLTLIVCWNITSVVFGVNIWSYMTSENANRNDQGIKIMTWNVHMFDLGEWTADKSTFAKILKYIEEENPDILCMQEYYRDEKDYSAPYTATIKGLGYPHESFMINGQWNKSKMTIHSKPGEVIDVGTVVYSKFPITEKTYKKLSGNGQGMHTVTIELATGKTFSLTVLHLTSFQLGGDDLDYIDDLKKQGVDAGKKDVSKGLIHKLIKASSMRAKVANEITAYTKQLEHPAIICGDFNDMPGSYVYRTIRGDMQDAFVSKGFGIGNTYQKILPILRIDYLFYDNSFFEAQAFKKNDIGLSDHYPILVHLKIK
jgi:endonuclease/exonuclease/phosphatase family metal-dependent hydrolase